MALDWNQIIKGAVIGAVVGIIVNLILSLLGVILGGVIAGQVARKTRNDAVVAGALAGFLIFLASMAIVGVLHPLLAGLFLGFSIVGAAFASIIGAIGGFIGQYFFRDKGGK